jgi:enoyl-CoA hydratase
VTVGVESRGQLRIITIDNPSHRNALDRTTFEGLGDAFTKALGDDDVRVVILTAVGDRAFCSGMDLKSFTAATRTSPPGPGTSVFAERFYPKPIVAAVNGAAVGGGLGIMLAKVGLGWRGPGPPGRSAPPAGGGDGVGADR